MTDRIAVRDSIIREIKAGGYWEVNIHPSIYEENRAELRDISKLVKQATVALRGWDYPHWGQEDEGQMLPNGIERWCRWRFIREFWRMTTSSNYYHIFSFREDRLEDDVYKQWGSRGEELRGKQWLGVYGCLYTLSEIFEFTKRLVAKDLPSEPWIASIKLHGLKGRSLAYDAFDKLSIIPSTVVPPTFDEFPLDQEASAWNFQTESENFALDAFNNLVHSFGWESVPINVFKDAQEIFLAGKL